MQDWDRCSTPLKPVGDVAKFIAKPQDKFSGNEKDNIFVHLEVFGDPVPKVLWFKVRGREVKLINPNVIPDSLSLSQGFKDLTMEGDGTRFKTWTDAETNSAILGVEGLKQEDEGLYKCILDNGNGEVEHEFNIYVTGTTWKTRISSDMT